MNNKTTKPEKKLFEFAGIYRRYVETDKITGKQSLGRLNEDFPFAADVFIQDNHTVVIFDDGSKGVAKCDETDNFDREKGLEIAYLRAMKLHIQKRINGLRKTKQVR